MGKQLTIFLFFFTALSASIAADDYVFRHYTVDDGLPYNGVRAICQDHYGFMWFGLDNGLCRYDGVRIKTYRHNMQSVDQFVSALAANDTCLWLGTSYGLTRMRFNDEKFVPFTVKTASGTAITSTVLNIATDLRGRLWICTQGQGVFCYDGERQQLRQYPAKSKDGDIIQIVADRNGQIWGVPHQGKAVLYKLSKNENQFTQYAPTCPYSLNYEVSTMIVDSKGCKWLGTRNHGLISITPEGSMKSWLSAGSDAVRKIHSILEVRPGTILIGSDDGLAQLNTATGQVKKYSAQSGQTGTLSDRFVYPLVIDREGGIWIGTFYGGVNYISPNSGRFQRFVHSTNHNSIGGNIINNFAEDKQGSIWIASDDGGLNKLDPQTGDITRYSLSSGKLSPGNVHGLWADADCLWVGTYSDGIYKMSYDGKSLKRYAAYKSSQPLIDAMSSYSLFRDSRGRLWSGSLESVSRYQAQSDDFVFVKRLGALVNDIEEDKQGNLWFATQGKGLYMLTPKGQWQHFSAQDKKKIADNNVNCVFIDSHGQVIIASKAGLSRYDTKTHQFVSLGIDLQGLEVTALIEDNGSFWITTVNGMVHYRQGEPLRWFNKHDGLQSNQFFPNAMLKSSDGHVYIGTNFGFNSFLPSKIIANKAVPAVAITGLSILNKPVETGSKTLPLAINHTKRIDLSHDENVLTLQFASLSYCTPENNKYAYKLEGLDNDWNYVGATTQATYTSLSPGTYKFRVKATNNDGIWGNDEAVLKIVIHPPFYLSLPMKVLYVCLVIAMIVMTVRMLLQRAEKRNQEEKDRLRAEKEQEVRDAKIGFFTMIAHEIRTPVSLIIGPLENILSNTSQMPKSVNDDLNIIDRNARRLLYLVNQLLDFRKIEQKSLVTQFTLCNIAQLVHTVEERFKPSFEQKGISFTTIYADVEPSAVVDSEAITKVVSNLLTNAMKYGRSKVKMTCEPYDNGNNVRITVSDDGQGIKPEDHERIFRPFFQSVNNRPGTGIGLSIVKNIIDRHHGTVSVDSEIGCGSIFTVIIPCRQPDAEVNEAAMEKTENDNPVVNDADDTTPAEGFNSDGKADDQEHTTILVVEDNDELLNFISKNLRHTYDVITARNGTEALAILKQRSDIGLVLSDWMMPGMAGDELCRSVRADLQTSHLPFILLTAKTDTGSHIEGMRCGADSYIEKPFSMQYLKECIKSVLNMRQLLRQKFSAVPLEPIKSIAPTDMDNDFLTRMQQIIEDNISNADFNINVLTKQLGMSRSSLFAKIKSLSGMTPNDMILLVRLNKAARMLKENKYHISEICYAVGFNNPSYFTKCFKRQFGITPNEFAAKKVEKDQ